MQKPFSLDDLAAKVKHLAGVDGAEGGETREEDADDLPAGTSAEH
jgi:hypothetical protein